MLLRKLHGSWVMFVYFAKVPVFFGVPMLYLLGNFKPNNTMNLLWLLSLVVIIIDIIKIFQRVKK